MGHQKHIKVTKAQISNDAETLVQSLERVTQQLKYSSQTHYSSGDGVWHSMKGTRWVWGKSSFHLMRPLFYTQSARYNYLLYPEVPKRKCKVVYPDKLKPSNSSPLLACVDIAA